MVWLLKFFNSSIGSKLLMSLTGLFLCSFLLVHMSGNLLLFVPDEGAKFNAYAYFMTNNLLIKTLSYGLYATFLLHAIKGLLMAVYNRSARGGQKYAGQNSPATRYGFAAYIMATLGIIVFAFFGLHMAQFWARMHFFTMPVKTYDGVEYKDLYAIVAEAFAQPWVVAVYLISLAALSLHLLHGFGSAFQTLGINHKKYSPIIRGLGAGFAILVPLGFAAMPIFFFLKSIGTF
jgi:succinate dehydrogenase / fumarate reductase cytochrome b subunit